jgi:hypothetical protein
VAGEDDSLSRAFSLSLFFWRKNQRTGERREGEERETERDRDRERDEETERDRRRREREEAHMFCPLAVILEHAHVLVSKVCQNLKENLSDIFLSRDFGIVPIVMAHRFDRSFSFR